MEDTSQLPYPSMLGSLEPAQAVQALNDRVKRIGKVNMEIADWLLERRKVEDVYAQGLKKLASRPLPGPNSELGIFAAPWQKIVLSAESISASHHALAAKIETDVEIPLRTFTAQNREMLSMSTVQTNLSTLSKELIDAQEKVDKLSKKGGKANVQKVETAATRLEAATTTWESQSPFIFEKLQALDEHRLNILRDILTQYETHEADCIERNRVTVESTIGSMVEVDTQAEIINWSGHVTAGKHKRERPTGASGGERRTQSSSSVTHPPPTSHGQNMDDGASEHSRNHHDGSSDGISSAFNIKKSRFGTMLGRRRQSIVGGAFGRAPSPSKGFAYIGGRGSGSRDGPSPRGSVTNLQEGSPGNKHLSTLPESPVSPDDQNNGFLANGGGSNGQNGHLIADQIQGYGPGALPDLSDVQPSPGPPPSHVSQTGSSPEPQRDSEGFTVPPAANDPISQAEQDAANEAREQQFKLDIRNEPIKEEDADAQAALSNVANTLRLGTSSMATPNRKAGTIRGRRDVRNTVYLPIGGSLDVLSPDSHGGIPPSPNFPRPTNAGPPTTSDMSHMSDTHSIRSSRSTGASGTLKHPDMQNAGLNASVIEVVTSTFVNGEITNTAVAGEIGFVYNAPSPSPSDMPSEIAIRLNNFPALNAIGPNRAFVKDVADKPGDYTLQTQPLIRHAALVGFKYKVHIDEANFASYSPLLIKAAWKPQGNKLGLVIEYKMNPIFSNEPLTIHDLGLIATYEAQKSPTCQTKPTGTHVKDRRMVYWRLGDPTFLPGDDESWHKVIARIVSADGEEPRPGSVEAKWEITGGSHTGGSGLGIAMLKMGVVGADEGKGKGKAVESDDPFADDGGVGGGEERGGGGSGMAAEMGGWVEVETVRKVVSGKYEAR